MTTTSSGDGASAERGGSASSDGRGWFTPARTGSPDESGGGDSGTDAGADVGPAHGGENAGYGGGAGTGGGEAAAPSRTDTAVRHAQPQPQFPAPRPGAQSPRPEVPEQRTVSGSVPPAEPGRGNPDLEPVRGAAGPVGGTPGSIGGSTPARPDFRGDLEPEPVHEHTARMSGPPHPSGPAHTAGPPHTSGPAHTGGPAHPAGKPGPSTPPSPDAVLIRRTMDEVQPQADAATAYFYALLFVQNPQLRDLFPASMGAQRDRLFKALLASAELVDDRERLTAYLAGLGRGHRKYGTRAEHYPAVGECLLAALAQYAPRTWSAEAEAAWVRAYTLMSQVMIDAAAEDERRAPAWWNAEVVAHQQRTSDIAVITVRPDQPYAFRAGQYAGIETPWWPRVWRHYSIACAPRSDGLLTFHVKAVPAGWVSSALVHRARPGDVLRLGPPAGSMTVDHSSGSGLLCVGGGTGIAPLKALVEDVAAHGRARPVELFYGARSEHDLYDLDAMMELERRHGWLSLRPVVSYGPGPAALRDRLMEGELPDAVRASGPWEAYEGYLSGPPAMIRKGVDALAGAGIPSHRIRHDAIEELVAAGD